MIHSEIFDEKWGEIKHDNANNDTHEPTLNSVHVLEISTDCIFHEICEKNILARIVRKKNIPAGKSIEKNIPAPILTEKNNFWLQFLEKKIGRLSCQQHCKKHYS